MKAHWEVEVSSRPGRFTPRERDPGTQWIGDWVSPGVGIGDEEKKIPTPAGTRTPDRPAPAHSSALYHWRWVVQILNVYVRLYNERKALLKVWQTICFLFTHRNVMLPRNAAYSNTFKRTASLLGYCQQRMYKPNLCAYTSYKKTE
jgi:hypothetical protein